MVDPERREGDLKERSLDYHKDEDSSTRSVQKSEKDANNGSGNLDSGYHSFGCPSNCASRNSEMITTTRGHDEDFPPPIPPRGVFTNGYRQPLDGNYVTKMHLHPDMNAVAERGCNSLPDMALYRNSRSVVAVSPALSASDSNFHRRSQAAHDSNAAEQEAADRTEELAEKIGFFFKLGYTAEQVRATLHKLGAQASKNDILMALGDFTSESASLPRITFSENEQALNETKPGDGLRNAGSAVELIPRGPSTVEDDTKDEEANASENLRPIVIDGSNVAMSHGNKEYFSCKGIQLAVQYFLNRGHRDITVFVPKYRKEHTRPDAPIKDQEILTKLQEEKILVWTPSRHIAGRRITCYDDRFILKLAQETEGVIVSNDNFRDLQNEKPEWKEVIEKRLLMYSFVNDRFMLPDDPLGRNGPSLDNFLRIRQSTEEKRKQCPYGKRLCEK